MDITVAQVIEQITAVTPGNVLLLAGMVILGLGMIPTSAGFEARRNLWGILSLFSIGMAAALAMIGEPSTATAFDQPSIALFVADDITNSGTWLALLAGLLLILVGWEHVSPKRASEYYAWLLLMLAGLIYTAGSRDLTSLFLSLELVSLPTTVLLGISRTDDSGREATLKYFTLAAFASGFFLLGCSYLYGTIGSTTLETIQRAVVEQRTPFCTVAITLAVVGLSFRVTAVPFHFYAPDVFAGTTLPMAAALSFIPKLAGFLGLIRLLGGTPLIKDFPPMVVALILVIAALTMTIGNCAALAQTNFRRLMAYSSVAHSGYLLLGLAAIMTDGGHAAPIFDYLAAYVVMTVGVFAVVASIRPAGGLAEDLSIFNGLYARNPLAAIALTIALLSLTGIPLTAGFWAKLQIFLATIHAQSTPVLVVAFIMAINAAIGAVYYLAIMGRMFQAAPAAVPITAAPATRLTWSTSAAALVCSVLTVAWFFAP
ncbi:MAG: NADH-quinone oxidoreductase subunit N [Pirellulaceae bacterium]|nr:NADH-quinone oxidoreductase subunit N [Pirellulaceae bacterium]